MFIFSLQRRKFSYLLLVPLMAGLLLAGGFTVVSAQAQLSLKDVPVPEPPNLADFVKDKNAAIALGKALFWDMQVGSDGVQACASCHFHAGADNRTKNQLNPGSNAGDNAFGNPASVLTGSVPGNPDFGPNYELTATDFPFHSRAPETAGVPRPPLPGPEFGNIVNDVNDVVSSQGVRLATFAGVTPGSDMDESAPLADQVFKLGSTNIRRVEPRNTPTVVNAVFNGDNFWDGRASMVFNGVNPFGFRDQTSTLKKIVKGTLTDVFVRIPYSSLASQAVGPPLSDFEMSFAGRDFPSIGRKMLSLRPLAKQLVHPQDSVLGSLSRATLGGSQVTGKTGLGPGNYAAMIKAAFQPQWWNSRDLITIEPGTQILKTPTRDDPRTFVVNPGKPTIKKVPANVDIEAVRGPNDFTQMEYNFSLFFGLAVQLYEATLVADDTPLDRFLEGDTTALTAQEQDGLSLFNANGCGLCHTLPETTEHTVRTLQVDSNGVPQNMVRWIPDGVGGGIGNPFLLPTAYIDFGMRNLAHRPSDEDILRAGTAPDLPPFQNPLDGNKPLPLSYVELWKLYKAGKLPAEVAAYVDQTPDAVFVPTPPVNDKSVTKGACKVLNLRLGEFTGPYFHDGTYSTLRQVVQFYARGGNFPQTNFLEIALGIVPDADITTEANIKALVAFLANGLTDQRVVFQKAPFDHPQLFIPNGCPDGDPNVDEIIEISAVGASGASNPIPTFLGLDPQAEVE